MKKEYHLDNHQIIPTDSQILALNRQEGGNHYKHFAIQPVTFCELNKLTPAEANVVKYVCRHRFKNGKQDLLKAKHYIDIMLELYYNDETTINKKD